MNYTNASLQYIQYQTTAPCSINPQTQLPEFSEKVTVVPFFITETKVIYRRRDDNADIIEYAIRARFSLKQFSVRLNTQYKGYYTSVTGEAIAGTFIFNNGFKKKINTSYFGKQYDGVFAENV